MTEMQGELVAEVSKKLSAPDTAKPLKEPVLRNQFVDGRPSNSLLQKSSVFLNRVGENAEQVVGALAGVGLGGVLARFLGGGVGNGLEGRVGGYR